MSSSSTSDEVAAATREVLESSNLDEINERKLRQLVGERTGADTSLPDLKALIHSVVEEFLEQDHQTEKREEADSHKANVKAVKLKKRKTEEPEDEEEQEEVDDEEPAHEQRANKKGSKQQPAKKFQVGESGELIVCKLSGKRRVSVGEFKGTLFVSIREFYEKDGQERPGKGISLPVDQWTTLSKHVDDINAAVKQASSSH